MAVVVTITLSFVPPGTVIESDGRHRACRRTGTWRSGNSAGPGDPSGEGAYLRHGNGQRCCQLWLRQQWEKAPGFAVRVKPGGTARVTVSIVVATMLL